MFRKIVLTVLVLGLMSGVAFAVPQTDNVVVNNTGNAGNIFVSTGTSQGNNQIGTWADGSSFKGDTGATGATGSQGEQGVTGKDGYTPIKDVDYTDGKDGEQGLQGLQGVAGQIGEQGLQGLTGQTGSDGKNGELGKTGNDGKEGKQGLQGERGKGLEDRYEVIGEVRLLDTKKTTWSVYAGRDFNNNVNIIGAKVTVKIGRSYYEKKIDALEAKVNSMVPEQVTETITKDKDGNVVSIHMSNNDRGASFTHSF